MGMAKGLPNTLLSTCSGIGLAKRRIALCCLIAELNGQMRLSEGMGKSMHVKCACRPTLGVLGNDTEQTKCALPHASHTPLG